MSDAPADQITDFQSLTVRHIGANDFRVLNLEEGTVSEVNIDTVTCNCEDNQYNQDGDRDVCKHVQMAMWQAPQARISIEETAPYYLGEAIEKAQAAAQVAQDVADNLDGALVSAREQQAETGQQSPDEPAPDPDDGVVVEDVEDWLETGFAKPDLVDVRQGSHDNVSGVVVEPQNQDMADHVYESFKGLMNSLEDSNVHVGFGDDPCHACGGQDGEFWYFVPGSDSSEVWG